MTGSSTTHGTQKPRRKRSRVVGCVCWAAVLMVGVWTTSWVWGWTYIPDLLANLIAQALLLGLCVLVVCALLRRRRACLVLAVVLATGLVPIFHARARLFPGEREPAEHADRYSFLHINVSSHRTADSVRETLIRMDADIVSLTELPMDSQRRFLRGDELSNLYPYKLERHWTRERLATAGVVLSRWPMQQLDLSSYGGTGKDIMAGVVQLDNAPLAVVAIHPRSPRRPVHWTWGNQTTQTAADVINDLLDDGYPVVLLADLNATPSGWRSRHIVSQTGLRRAKPIFLPAGTYPAELPWPMSVAIDDAWVSDGLEVLSWDRPQPEGSDHYPVLLEIGFPPGITKPGFAQTASEKRHNPGTLAEPVD